MTISIPKNQTGIKQSLVQTYAMNDVAWRNKSDLSYVNFPKFDYLSNFAVRVGETTYLRDKTTGRWTDYGKEKDAKRSLTQQRGGMITLNDLSFMVTADDVALFFAGGIIRVQGTIYAPGCPDLVIYNNEKRLNIYTDGRLHGDTDHITNTEEFLKIIRNSLCNEPDEIDLDAMREEIASDRRTPFRWVMHWLAARFQMPGFTTQTNLWFMGARGTGKGSLVSMMRRVLGDGAVGKASQEDIAKGWTDCFLNKQLMEWDEFKASGGWREFSNLLKEKTGNETISVNRRNVGVSEHPAVAMHIFSTNEERPILVEPTDRQNTFIKTTSNIEWIGSDTKDGRVKKLWNPVTGEFADPDLPSGFAALLNEIVVDIPFIRRPYKTEQWDKLCAVSEDTVSKWVNNGGLDDYRGETKVRPWELLHDLYVNWTRTRTFQKPLDLADFKAKMNENKFSESGVGK